MHPVVAYHIRHGKREDARRTALLVKRGTKHLHVIIMRDAKVSVDRVPLTEERSMIPLEYKGRPYPVERAVRIFKRHGKAFDITKAAREALKQLTDTTDI